MLKKIMFTTIAIFLCQTAHASLIALDNQYPDHCRQQITHAGDPKPVIFVFMEDCPYAKKLLPIYEEISNELPNRAFFTFEFSGKNGNDYLKAKTAHDCLNTIPLYSPMLYVYDVITTTYPEYPGAIMGVYKQGLDGSASKQDILDFVNNKSNMKNTNKTFSSIAQVYSPSH